MKSYQIVKKGCAVFAKQNEKNEKLFVACSAEDGGERHVLPKGSVLQTNNPIIGKMRLVTAVIADAEETKRADDAEARVEELEAELAKKVPAKGDGGKALKDAKAEVKTLKAAAVKDAKALKDAKAEIVKLKKPAELPGT